MNIQSLFTYVDETSKKFDDSWEELTVLTINSSRCYNFSRRLRVCLYGIESAYSVLEQRILGGIRRRWSRRSSGRPCRRIWGLTWFTAAVYHPHDSLVISKVVGIEVYLYYWLLGKINFGKVYPVFSCICTKQDITRTYDRPHKFPHPTRPRSGGMWN